MPAKSEKQRRFMAAVANNPKFAKKVGVPQSVGEEFMEPKKYKKGGKAANKQLGGRRGLRGMAEDDSLAPRSAPVPKMRPSLAPRRAPVPKMRPEDSMSPDSAVGRGNRAAMREAEDMPPMGMKKGGKVRGAGMARKGVRPCKMC
jgi:hypothetical protein